MGIILYSTAGETTKDEKQNYEFLGLNELNDEK
jgi:hypothetical protein